MTPNYDLSLLANRLQQLGLMQKAFADMSKDEVLQLIDAVYVLLPDELATAMREKSRLIGELLEYRHLAPCPKHNGWFVYRGQACAVCPDKESCIAWPTLELDPNIKPLKKGMEKIV